MKTGIVIQARMGSTRLPGKVMEDICGKPALQRVIERAQKIKGIDDLLVVTPRPIDSRIGQLCADLGVTVLAGPEDDVLQRYYSAAKYHKLDAIVRITADCPLLDPQVSSTVVARFIYAPIQTVDYASNVHPPSYPDGLDTEIFSFAALEKAFKNATDPYDREHVTPFIYRRPSPFRLANVWNKKDLSRLRWTLDTPQDLTYIREVYERIGLDMPLMDNVLGLLDRKSDLVYTKDRMV